MRDGVNALWVESISKRAEENLKNMRLWSASEVSRTHGSVVRFSYGMSGPQDFREWEV